MPSKAGSPFIGARRATPLLPTAVSLTSNSRMKLVYSLSLTSQLPRLLPECRIPSSTDHSTPAGAFFARSFHSVTIQPLGAPSSVKSLTNPSSAGDAGAHVRSVNAAQRSVLLIRIGRLRRVGPTSAAEQRPAPRRQPNHQRIDELPRQILRRRISLAAEPLRQ